MLEFLSLIILNAECRVFYCYADSHPTECHYAEFRYAKCCGAIPGSNDIKMV